MFVKILVLTFFGLITARDRHVLMTEVFDIVIDPPMFNWTYEEIENQYEYEASLLNAPDLPSWMHLMYSNEHQAGFLFGVPPKKSKPKIPLQIVVLNKKNYDVRIENLNIIVSQKMRPARYEVHIKIDNLNVVDMFDAERMHALKNIFREQLWKNSASDLYVTFLGSAVELGARKPLIPTKEEGVVVRLGSYEPFSTELRKLEEEVVPLRKMVENMQSCPRKRTSVERLFRDAHFTLDWCSFRLIEDNNSEMHDSGANEKLLSVDEDSLSHNQWEPVSRSNLPQRNYYHELLVSILVPMFIMITLASILSLVLCFHPDDIEDEESEEYFKNLFHICTDFYYDHYIYRSRHIDDITSEERSEYTTIQRATESIRSLSKSREMSMSPDPMLLSRSHTNSPTSTISRGVHCRPSPPPYIRPKFKPAL